MSNRQQRNQRRERNRARAAVELEGMKFIAGVPGVRASKNGHLYTPHKVAELAVATREYVLNVFAVDNASRKHLSERKTEKPKLTLNRGWGNRAL